ncbi:MAG: protein kinase [Deltaproteobacteria bacterium]
MVETAVDAAGRTAMFVARDLRGGDGIVKVVPKPKGVDPDPLRAERFLAEVAELRALDHPGLVPILDAGVTEDCYYLVLQRVDGCTLDRLLDDVSATDFGTLLAIALEVGDTLARLHDVNVTVRDLEPANVVIDQRGRAVIGGVALSALTRLHGGQHVLGVPGYVAPELLLGLSPSPLSDQFSFGRLLLTLAGTNRPIDIDRSKPLKAQLSTPTVDWSRYPTDDEGFDALFPIVQRLTASRAAERYPTMDEALAQLVELALHSDPVDELVEDRTMPMPPVSAPTAPAPSVSRTRSIVVSSGGGLELEVEDYQPLAETTASHRILPSLRTQAERHLAERGSVELSSHAALPIGSEGAEPATVRQRLTPDDAAETIGPDRDLSGLQVLAASDTIPNARLPSRREALFDDKLETIVPGTGPTPLAGPPTAPTPMPEHATAEDTLSQRPPPPARPTGPAPAAPASRPDTQPDLPVRSDTVPDASPAPRDDTAPPRAPADDDHLETIGADEPVMPPAESAVLVTAPVPVLGAPARPRFRWGAFVVGLVVAVAAVWGGRMLYERVERASTLPDVMPLTTRGPARYHFYGQVPVEPQVVRRARNYYARARRALEENRVDEAERALGICIEIADLAECHRTLAAILSLTNDPAAAAHLERYLSEVKDDDLASRLPPSE